MADVVKFKDDGTISMPLPNAEGRTVTVQFKVPTVGDVEALELAREALQEPLTEMRIRGQELAQRHQALQAEDAEEERKATDDGAV